MLRVGLGLAAQPTGWWASHARVTYLFERFIRNYASTAGTSSVTVSPVESETTWSSTACLAMDGA